MVGNQIDAEANERAQKQILMTNNDEIMAGHPEPLNWKRLCVWLVGKQLSASDLSDRFPGLTIMDRYVREKQAQDAEEARNRRVSEFDRAKEEHRQAAYEAKT